MKPVIQQISISEPTKDDLLTIMDLIGKEAQENGLTEEILEELLTDES
jgi:hypothetical protein